MKQIERFQRSRVRGRKLPPQTLIVTRPTIWGNPWDGVEAAYAYRLFVEQVIQGEPNIGYIEEHLRVERVFSKPIREWVDLRNRMIEFPAGPLKGVACWCDLSKPCHADVIRAIPHYLTWIESYRSGGRSSADAQAGKQDHHSGNDNFPGATVFDGIR